MKHLDEIFTIAKQLSGVLRQHDDVSVRYKIMAFDLIANELREQLYREQQTPQNPVRVGME